MSSLEEARRGTDRVQPADLASELTAGPLVVDTRPADQRRRDGECLSTRLLRKARCVAAARAAA